MTRVLALVGVIGLVAGVRLVLPGVGGGESAAMALGFVLVASFLLGGLVTGLALPAITGYLLVGMLFGPHVLPWIHAGLSALAVLDANAVGSLRLLDAVALGLIALTAGGELKISALRRSAGAIVWIVVLQMVLVLAGMVALGWGLQGFTALFAGLPRTNVLAAVLLLGAMATANSPASILAVIQEFRTKGPVTETVLAVTVVKDVVVLSLFTVVMAFALVLVRPTATFDLSFMLVLGWEITGSLLLGAVLGWLLARYLEHWGHEMPLLVLAAAFISMTLLPPLHLSGLLALMTAGFYIENFSAHGDDLIKAIERHALPVYVVFFTITGAGLDLNALWLTLPFALVMVTGRMALTAAATMLGARAAGAPRAMILHGWSGFVAQAGVTLGFAILVEQRFPEIGAEVKTATLAMVAVNQLVGPVLFRLGLGRAGEIPAAEEPLEAVRPSTQ